MEEAKVYEKILIGCYKEDLLLGHVPGEYLALHEKCPDTEFFLVRIFPYLDRIRRFTYIFGHFSRSLVYTNPFLNVSETPWLSLSLGKENGFAFSAKFVFETSEGGCLETVTNELRKERNISSNSVHIQYKSYL